MVELLAPAGNPESFIGAINAGADAVYLGGSRFGARAYAENFSDEELVRSIRYAHLCGRKVYLTVNTLLKQEEVDEVSDYLKPLYEAGLDGVIVQDLGVFACIRQNFPDLELHASTQMTITGAYGAGLIRNLGAVRIVPARELSLEEIRLIRQRTGLQIEVFIHGAMCYCYSGQCLFSSILGGRSGNRGRCAQPCRLAYKMTTGGKTSEECYPLSLKDMCTIERIPEFIRAGIDSFKIEGRMKKPEYVAGVTSIYRKYIDKFYEDEKASEHEWKIEEADLLTLSSLYIRTGIQEGYYHKHNGREMVTLDSPAYKQNDEKMLLALREKYLTERKKFPVSIDASFQMESPARLSMSCLGTTVEVTGETVQKASKTPVGRKELEERVSKLGETNFTLGEINIDADADIFYPVGKLNALRREACEELQEAVIFQNGFQNRTVCDPGQQVPDGPDLNYKSEKGEKCKAGECAVSVRTYDQLEAVSDFDFYSRIYLDGDLFLQKSGQLTSLLLKNHYRGVEIVLSLPYILRKRDEEGLEKLYELFQKEDYMTGIQIRSLEGAGFLFERNFSKKLFTDAGFYVWNKETAKVFSDLYRVTKFCLPYELNSAGQRRLAERFPCEKVVYGRIPMMLTANCIAKTSGNCVHGKETKAFLTDRYQVRFPVLLDCVHCMNIIYNSVPLSLHGKVKEAMEKMDIRLDFTLENAKECRKVMAFFGGLITGDKNDIKPPYQEYTTGHEKRGVE